MRTDSSMETVLAMRRVAVKEDLTCRPSDEARGWTEQCVITARNPSERGAG